MRRRRLLGVAAAGVGGIAGCLDRIDTDGATGFNGETTERETTADRKAILREVVATPEIVALNSPDSIGTYGDRGEQFLAAIVGWTGEDAPVAAEYALDAGEETFEPTTEFEGGYLWEPRNGDQRGSLYEDGSGWVPFKLPKPLEAEGATIAWPGGEYALGERAVERLSRPPTEFEVREFTAPNSVENYGTATLALSVANVGEADGTFVGALNRSGPDIDSAPERAIAIGVPAGDSATWEHELRIGTEPPVDKSGPTANVRLRHRGQGLTREIAVETE